jgi:PAS domain S-box-containing protein
LKDGREKWVNFKAIPIKSAEGVFLGHRGVVRDVTQEKRAEQMLAAKTTELETAKRIAGLGVWYWDVLTDAIQVDAKMREIYGVDENDMPTKLLDWGLRFYTKADIDLHRADYDRRFDGMPINNTRAIQRARGEIRWVHTLGSPVLDRHGALIGYRGITRDITSEKEAERRLAESEERYRLISENMRDIVAVHDPDGTIVYASPSLTRTLGYSVEKTFGKKPFAFIHPEDLEHVKQAVRDVVDGRSEASSVWYRFRHLDGHECWMESVIVPVRHPDGLIRQYQTATREISQRKQAERALRASEERFRSLTELSSDWYWELDAQFRFSFISRDKAKRTRRTREDLMGRTRWDVFPTAMTPEEWAAHRADLEAHRPFFNLVMRVVDPDTDETRGYSSLNGEPVFDENGKFTGYRGTGQDITERKLAEAALAKRTRELALTNKRLEEEAQQRKQLERNFLMAIEMELAQVGLELHDDLGQDLTGVALLTKTLEKKLAEQGMAESADAARISELTNRAIKHTRMISHGLSPYIWGSAGLISALTQMANDISVLGVVECEVDIDKKIEIEDEVVARNLYRITQESVNNALKHSRARRIGISLTQTGKNISLTIADDGIGRSDVPAPDDAESKFHSIRHRANSINAKLSVRRGRRGGTVVKVHCQSALEYYLPPHTEEMS